MITVRAGEQYKTNHKKHGATDKGEYFLFGVNGEKGSDRITVFAANPSEPGLDESDWVRIKSIQGVSITSRNYQGKWFSNYNVTAVLEPQKKNSDEHFKEYEPAPVPDNKEIDALFGLF